MSRNQIFDVCKALALSGNVDYENYGSFLEIALRAVRGDREPEPGTRAHAVYADAYGCDFRIYYDYEAKSVSDIRENMRVFSGGREVYQYRGYDGREEFVSGYWEDFARQAEYYIGDVIENTTSVVLAQEEAMKNRQFLERYRKIGIVIAETKGAAKTVASGKGFVFERIMGGHKIEIFLTRRLKTNSDVVIFYDSKVVFSFSWDCKIDAGGILDNKGRFTRGEWEDVIDELYQKL